LLIDKGFDDVWIKAGQGLGFTGHQDPDLLNPVAELNRRISLSLTKMDGNHIAADLVWHEQRDRTITGLRQQITLEQRAEL
jgi:hypothetical protein